MVLAQIKYSQSQAAAPRTETSFLEQINRTRMQATSKLDTTRRGSLGQFFTPLPIAQMMSSMLGIERRRIYLLDAGAGTGVLTAAFVNSVCESRDKPKEIIVTAVELDEFLIPYLQNTLEICQQVCEQSNIKFTARIYNEDFIKFAVNNLSDDHLTLGDLKFDVAILNPPYGKINADSDTNRILRRSGIVTPNIYTSFLALSAEMLAPGGELVAITLRSFCNGTYYKPFRRYFLERMSFLRFHVFEARKDIFDEDILQENIIFHAVKNKSDRYKDSDVTISTSRSGVEGSSNGNSIKLKNTKIVKPGDSELFIHLGAELVSQGNTGQIKEFKCSLEDLGLQVSTGKVVDFRSREFLQNGLSNGSSPLIYPHNLQKGIVQYPVNHRKKFDSIRVAPETESLLVRTGMYVLVKRFSAKEEKKRITAFLFEGENVPGEKIGFENHLNYFHVNGQGINAELARGLALYLNSGLIDDYFRRFSGHTQVNATDLRYLKYPTCADLEKLGEHFAAAIDSQEKTDSLINRILLK